MALLMRNQENEEKGVEQGIEEGIGQNISYEPADIMIHVQGRGIVLKEKSLIAYQKKDNKIVASGTEAERMAEQGMEDIVIVSPLRQGMVADYIVAVGLFSHMFMKALGKRQILKPAVAVCVPKGITSVEKQAIKEVLVQSVASEVLVSDIPAEEFIREFPAKFPKAYRKFKIIVGIMKDEPERYVEERLRDMMSYAGQEQIPRERVYALLQKNEQNVLPRV